jgi:hypothetical protein
VLTVVAVLAGCAHKRDQPRDGGADSLRPVISVVDGRIVVEPEVLVYRRGQGAVDITFTLDEKSNLSFPGNGIVIEGRLLDEKVSTNRGTAVVLDPKQDEISCKPGPASYKDRILSFICHNRHTKPGVYQYSIRVNTNDGRSTLHRDPPMVNM